MSQDGRRTGNLGAGVLEEVTQVLRAGQFCGGTRRPRSPMPRRKAQELHAQKKGPDPGHHQRPEGTAMTPTGQPHPSLRVDFTDTQTRRQ